MATEHYNFRSIGQHIQPTYTSIYALKPLNSLRSIKHTIKLFLHIFTPAYFLIMSLDCAFVMSYRSIRFTGVIADSQKSFVAI